METEVYALNGAMIVDALNPEPVPRNIIVESGKIVDISTQPLKSDIADRVFDLSGKYVVPGLWDVHTHIGNCLLYTSPSPRDATLSRMPSSA